MISTYVIIHNDNEHSYDYVSHLLSQVFNVEPNVSYLLAREIDLHGRCVVEVADQNAAERIQQEIQSFGADPMIKASNGPLKVTIEQGNFDSSIRMREHTLELGERLEQELNRIEANESSNQSTIRSGTVVNLIGIAAFICAMIGKELMKEDLKAQATVVGMSMTAAFVFYLWSLLIFSRARRLSDNRAAMLMLGVIGELYLIYKNLF